MSRVLVTLGDVEQIRWLFQSALDVVSSLSNSNINSTSGEAATAAAAAVSSSRREGPTGSSSKKQGLSVSSQRSPSSYFAALREEWDLLEEFLQAEITLGQCGVRRLNELRDRRDRVRGLLEESQRTRFGLNVNIGQREKDRDRGSVGGAGGVGGGGIYDYSYDLLERYDPLQQFPQKQQRQLSYLQLLGLEHFVYRNM
jgi:hypothetical protein